MAEAIRKVLAPKMEKLYDEAFQDGKEVLAAKILCLLKIHPNNVERIERIRELCNKILNHKKQED